MAGVQVNGHISDRFLLQGTREGRPLLPLLFDLALEPLAAAICQSPNIIGFCSSLGEKKIILYADDAVLFQGDTSYSLVAVMSLIIKYDKE